MFKKNILIIILSCFFLSLIVLIKTNLIVSFDTFIYNLVTLKMTSLITSIYKLITFLGSTPFIVSLCVFFFIIFIILKKKNLAFIIPSCLIISTIINNLVKVIIRRPRPEVLKLVTEKTLSFPSGHMMASVSMYGLLLYLIIKSNLNKREKWLLSILLILLPILVGLSRIYLGAHFASDIIGGALLSIILLLIEIRILEKKNWL